MRMTLRRRTLLSPRDPRFRQKVTSWISNVAVGVKNAIDRVSDTTLEVQAQTAQDSTSKGAAQTLSLGTPQAIQAAFSNAYRRL